MAKPLVKSPAVTMLVEQHFPSRIAEACDVLKDVGNAYCLGKFWVDRKLHLATLDQVRQRSSYDVPYRWL